MTDEDKDRVEKAIDFVDKFVADAHYRAYRDYEATLYKIARLEPWKAWRAPQMAEEVLGVGPYWNRQISPKSLLAYYMKFPFRYFYEKIWPYKWRTYNLFPKTYWKVKMWWDRFIRK